MKTIHSRLSSFPMVRPAGFSLLEIMIALALGLLLSIGIMTLFSGTSRTNKLQDALARLQENGRFAVTRIERDLRMSAGQFCSNTAGSSSTGLVPIVRARAPMVYAPELHLPDSMLNSLDATGLPSAAPAAAPYILSPRWFLQGYSCTASACTPALPSATAFNPTPIPPMGLAVGQRVPASDVLTIRYLRGTGWGIVASDPSAAPPDLSNGATITVKPLTGDDDFSKMKPGLALITDCISPAIVPIAAAANNVATIGGILPGASDTLSHGSRIRDMRLFNFDSAETGFVTVSYYLAFRADDNPDARPNSTAAKRLIPVLIRRENGVEEELVRGVDQMVFRYGVLDKNGTMTFMDANEIEAKADTAADTVCTPPPDGIALEKGCLWRTVLTIEPHLLVNTVDELFGLDDVSRTYRFNGSTQMLGDTALLPSGLKAGSHVRREFVAYINSRNRNF